MSEIIGRIIDCFKRRGEEVLLSTVADVMASCLNGVVRYTRRRWWISLSIFLEKLQVFISITSHYDINGLTLFIPYWPSSFAVLTRSGRSAIDSCEAVNSYIRCTRIREEFIRSLSLKKCPAWVAVEQASGALMSLVCNVLDNCSIAPNTKTSLRPQKVWKLSRCFLWWTQLNGNDYIVHIYSIKDT